MAGIGLHCGPFILATLAWSQPSGTSSATVTQGPNMYRLIVDILCNPETAMLAAFAAWLYSVVN